MTFDKCLAYPSPSLALLLSPPQSKINWQDWEKKEDAKGRGGEKSAYLTRFFPRKRKLGFGVEEEEEKKISRRGRNWPKIWSRNSKTRCVSRACAMLTLERFLSIFLEKPFWTRFSKLFLAAPQPFVEEEKPNPFLSGSSLLSFLSFHPPGLSSHSLVSWAVAKGGWEERCQWKGKGG